MMVYLSLFWVFFKIGLFGFGGGYAIAALMQDEIVNINQWLTLSQFTDIMAISQVTPGPIAINSATYVGYVATGNVWGSLTATFAVCLPSFILMGLIVYFLQAFQHNKYVEAVFWGIRPATIGLIAAAAIMLANSENFIDVYSYIIFGVVGVLALLKVNPIFLIILSGIAGFFLY